MHLHLLENSSKILFLQSFLQCKTFEIWSFCKVLSSMKCIVMQIEKALINDCLRVLKVP